MREQLILYETAKLAKEKGFNVETECFYTKPRSKMFGIDEHGRNYPAHNTSKKLYQVGYNVALNIESVYSAPTQSLLQKWLREIHNIQINIIKLKNSFMFFCFKEETSSISQKGFVTYEKALEKGLQEALKLIK